MLSRNCAGSGPEDTAMDACSFARLVREEAIDATVQAALKQLISPSAPRSITQAADPLHASAAEFFNRGAIEQQRRAAWFQQLNDEQQSIVADILRDCAECSALSFCSLIDGIGGNYEGAFEITAIDSEGTRTVLNPENSEMLHDVLSEVCAG
jgi:hypothetical protein